MPYKDLAKRALWYITNRERTRATQNAYKQTEKGKLSTKRHNHTPAAIARRHDGYYSRQYGLTAAEAKAYKASVGLCQVCASEGPLVIDHIHGTKIIRGVLCNKCNKALGLLGDTKEGVARALAYISKCPT